MISKKIVLITGASSGIGAAVAKNFAKAGYLLSLTDRNEDNLQKIASECEKDSSHKPLAVVGDLTNQNNVKNIFETTIKHYKKLDVLINNAGVLEFGGIENTSLEQFDRVFDTNVKSMYQLTALAVPRLITAKGSIVNVSSINGVRSFPGLLAYNMSKSAVGQFTRCVALELGDRQVRVNCVAPGIIITELHKTGGYDEETYKKFIEKSKETHPLGRAGNPQEVADAIAFLASKKASFITGVTLSVDGGRHALCPR